METRNIDWKLFYCFRFINTAFYQEFERDVGQPIVGIAYTKILHGCGVTTRLNVVVCHCVADAGQQDYISEISIENGDRLFVSEARRVLDNCTMNRSDSDLLALMTRFNECCRNEGFYLSVEIGRYQLRFKDRDGRLCCIEVNPRILSDFIELSHNDLVVFVEYPFAEFYDDGDRTISSLAEEFIVRHVDASKYVNFEDLQFELGEFMKKECSRAAFLLNQGMDEQIEAVVHKWPLAFSEQRVRELREAMINREFNG